MLGHDRSQSNQANFFKITQYPLSPVEQISSLLVERFAPQYPILSSLSAVLSGESLFRFLFVFAETMLRVPESPCDEETDEMSHLPDILERFGEVVHRDIIRHYHGQLLKIPPFERFRAPIRNCDIFLLIKPDGEGNPSAREMARASKYYNMAVTDVRSIWLRMQEPGEAVEE